MRFLLTLSRLAVVALACRIGAAAAAPSAQEILQQVDRYRLPVHSFEAQVRITPLLNHREQDSGTYLIRGANYNQVLVEATSADQRGQKFLSTDSGLYFYAPRTRRAIRLTPLQTLLGKASIGDLARISFEHDYDAAPTDLPAQSCPDQHCLALLLTSKSDAATYTKIMLLVGKQRDQYLPLKAMLYVASGKLLKIALFEPSSAGLPPITHYLNPLDQNDETRVVFEKIRAAEFPLNTFNPRTLEQ